MYYSIGFVLDPRQAQGVARKRAGLAPSLAFRGLASSWEPDRYGDQLAPGAYAHSLAEWRERNAMPPVLWCHDQRVVLGAVTEAQESDRGLEIEAEIEIGTDEGRRAYALLELNALSLSVGFNFRETDTEPAPAGGQLFRHVEWIEVSLVAVPANAETLITAVEVVRSGDLREHFGDRAAFEQAIRKGLPPLSRNLAKTLAATAWPALTQEIEQPNPAELDALKRALAAATQAFTR